VEEGTKRRCEGWRGERVRRIAMETKLFRKAGSDGDDDEPLTNAIRSILQSINDESPTCESENSRHRRSAVANNNSTKV